MEPKTHQPVMELPLYGVNMDKALSAPGNFTGTMMLGQGLRDDLVLAGSAPGRYGLMCLRDDIPIWGGIIWSRTWDSSAKTLQFTAQTYESIFARIRLKSDFLFASISTNLGVIWSTLVSTLQAQDSGAYNFGFTTSIEGSAVLSPLNEFFAAGNRMWSEVVEELLNYEAGMQYTINFTGTGGGTISKVLQTRLNSTPTSSGLMYDYPGQVSKYWYNENAARGAVVHTAHANDFFTSSGPAFAQDTWSNLITAGYVPWENVYRLNDIESQAQLLSYAQQKSQELVMPVSDPTFELGAGNNFTGWNMLGQTIDMYVNDERFPDGKTFTDRLNGWSLTPEAGDTEEVLRLVLKGDA